MRNNQVPGSAFRSLLELKEGTYTVAAMAAGSGKSEAYVLLLCSQNHKPYYVANLVMLGDRLWS